MFSVRDLGNVSCWLLLGGLMATVGCAPATTSVSTAQAVGQATTNTSVSTLGDADKSPGTAEAPCCVEDAACCEEVKAKVEAQPVLNGVVIPDVMLVNQDGEQVRFHSELVRGKIVAINFIFTTCKGICPPMSANFAQLQKQLGDRYGNKVALVSVSVDPKVDTAQRLKAWRETFGGGPGWTLLTGDKQDVDRVLKEMEVFTADKNDHSPFILLGDDAAGKWTRVHGLTAPDRLAEMIAGMYAASRTVDEPISDPPSDEGDAGRVSTDEPTAPHKYFTDVELINQHGETMRLYSDVLDGKVVVINSFFSTCKGSCPVMLSSFAKIQEQFSERLGKDLYLVSLTVDPQTDTPQVLAAYAEQWQAKSGWLFLTGDKANVDAALYKLGHYVENKQSHSNIFLIGNVATGLWKKARGLSPVEQVFPLIEEVLADKPL